MTATFRTVVLDLPPTPLGLLPRQWRVEHQCTLCHDKVATDELIDHARAHSPEQRTPDQVP